MSYRDERIAKATRKREKREAGRPGFFGWIYSLILPPFVTDRSFERTYLRRKRFNREIRRR